MPSYHSVDANLDRAYLGAYLVWGPGWVGGFLFGHRWVGGKRWALNRGGVGLSPTCHQQPPKDVVKGEGVFSRFDPKPKVCSKIMSANVLRDIKGRGNNFERGGRYIWPGRDLANMVFPPSIVKNPDFFHAWSCYFHEYVDCLTSESFECLKFLTPTSFFPDTLVCSSVNIFSAENLPI